ncbi:MAG: nitroreductase [Candidatus Nitrosotenuis sp.]|nr:MAG: nitroreductase [Candidatus Nitrosotenuis sp.]
MSFFDLISSRHSVRAFKEQKMSGDVIEKILAAATRASSAGNLQSYQIFVVSKKEDKKRLAVAAHGQNFIENASTVFVFCADPNTSAREYGKRGEDLYCIQDATIACSYAQLAAHSLGFSSVWVGSFIEDEVANTLGLPSGLKAIAMLVVGTSAEKPEITTRRPLSEITHIMM